MAIVFDTRGPWGWRWRDTITGRYSRPPFIPVPDLTTIEYRVDRFFSDLYDTTILRGEEVPVEERWAIEIEYEYRAFRGKRVSPPLSDSVRIPWTGQKPTSLDVLSSIQLHEEAFRGRKIYVFNQSSAVIPINVSARLAGG